jgi:hypothetical protein
MQPLGKIIPFSQAAQHTSNHTPLGTQWSDPRRASSSASAPQLRRPSKADDSMTCFCGCGETLTALGRGPFFLWSRCTKRETDAVAQIGADEARFVLLHEAQARDDYTRRVKASGLGALNGMTLDAFHRSWLSLSPDGTHPVDVATAWLRDALDYGLAANYRDVHSPPACLYLCSAGKGRGKTHLAAALGWWALEQGRTVAWVDELGYTRRRSTLPFEQIEALVGYPADVTWLTIIDGLGEREDPPASVANAWHELINPRWLRGGWTVITSNDTPDELRSNGTIGDATYSRLQQMTAGYVVEFAGTDARLRSAEE